MQYILALDQGTTSSRSILFDTQGQVQAVAQKEFEQHYPQPGWVEHDANEIWSTQMGTASEAMSRANVEAEDLAAIGITNQRETTVVWDRATGTPIHNAIVWQDRRTSGLCDRLKDRGHLDLIQEKTGLIIDAYFSGTKIKWLLDNVDGARERAENGELAFGTVDSWLVWRMTNGKRHVTDATNASRTLLYNIHEGELASDDLFDGAAGSGTLKDRRDRQPFPVSQSAFETEPHVISLDVNVRSDITVDDAEAETRLSAEGYRAEALR